MLFPLTFSRRIPRWLIVKASVSSISFANTIPEIHPNIPNPRDSDFQSKIQSLRTTELYPDLLIEVLQSTPDIHSALKLFKWASLQNRFHHTADTYYWMIMKLGMAGNLQEMEVLCHNMVKAGCPGAERALVSLVYSFVRHRRLNEAARVLVIMTSGGHVPSVDAFNVVLGALVEEKRGFQDVVFVYKEMVKAGVAPTAVTLNYVLEVLFDTGRVVSALDQYRRMGKKGCKPTSRTFEIVIKGLITKNRVDDSITILREMMELECQLELSFYTSTIPFFCKENKLEEGIRLFRMMKASNLVPDLLVYEALIQCMCDNLLLDDAGKLVEEMIERGLIPDDAVLVDLVNGFCKVGLINDAIKLLEGKHVLQASPYNALLRGCCEAGEFSLAKGLIEKLSQKNIADCESWNILIRWLCQEGKLRKAYELLGRMTITSLVPDSATFSALVLGNCRLSRYEDALKLFLQLRAKCWDLDSLSYSELVEGLCKAERFLQAVKLFLYMSENGCALHPSSFNVLIKGLCNAGLVNIAVKLRLLAYHSGTYCAKDADNCIMLGLSKSDNAKSLLVFLSKMLVEGCKLDAEVYCILIRSMAAWKQLKNCALVFNRMVDEGLVPDPSTLNMVVSYLATNSRLSLVATTIDRLVCGCEIQDSVMYNTLVNGFWKEGNKNEARRLLDLMLEKGWVPDATSHRLLIGSVKREETGERALTHENIPVKDDISEILDEGLGQSANMSSANTAVST